MSRVLQREQYVLPSALLLLVLLSLTALRADNFYTSIGLASAIASAAPLILATMAITPVALAGRGGVDLSIGPLVAMVNVTTVHWLVNNGVTTPILIIGFAVALGIAVGAVQGALISVLRLQPVIVTLSGFLVLAGLNLTILPTPGGTVPQWLADWGSADSVFSPTTWLVLIAFLIWWAIDRTALARDIRFIGSNERTAYASGVRLIPTRITAHAIGGFFAGLAGLAYTALIASADPTQGVSYTLMAITALVLGGVSLAGGSGGGLGAILGAINIFLIGYVLATFDFGTQASFVVQLVYGTVLVLTLAAGTVINSVVALRRSRRGSAEVAA